MRKFIVILVLWLATWVFNAGALFAYLQASHFSAEYARLDYRGDLAAAWGWGMFGPLGLPVAIFGTGFLEHGWRLK